MRKNIVMAIAFLFCISVHAFGQTKELDMLNNKAFTVTLKQVKGEVIQRTWIWGGDEISFARGSLTSKVMKAHEHFFPAGCSASADSSSGTKVVTFKGTGANLGSYTIDWQGTVKGDAINGTAVWHNGYGTQVYAFTGTLKK